MKIGFIGLGNMATAMIGGIIKQEIVSAKDILGSARTEQTVKKAEDAFGITGCKDNAEVAGQADILFLAVKPQMYPDVIGHIKDAVKPETIVVSIAPGKTIAWLTELFGKEVKLVRCMPNTPALVGEGCTGVCKAENVKDAEMEQVLSLLDGMPRTQAYEFAAQSVLGSAKMVLETGMHPGVLKDMVCSPAGTTIEAVRVLEKSGFRSAVIEAQKACVEKAKGV